MPRQRTNLPPPAASRELPKPTIRGFIDDSGDAQLPAVVVGGLVTSEAGSRLIEERWRVVLKRFGQPECHAKDIPAITKHWPRKKANSYMQELTDAILTTRIQFVGAGLLQSDYEQTCREFKWFRDWARQPLTFCVHSAIQSSAAFARAHGPGHRLELPMDKPGNDFAGSAERAREAYLDAANWNGSVGQFLFDSRLKTIPLQCADFVAHEMFLEFKRSAEKDRRKMRIPLKRLISESGHGEFREIFRHLDLDVLRDVATKAWDSASKRMEAEQLASQTPIGEGRS